MGKLLSYYGESRKEPDDVAIVTIRIPRELHALAKANKVNFTKTLNAVLRKELLGE